jgi:S-adenosylmethionine synthetase
MVEKDEAATEILNVTASASIARLVNDQGGALLHISSDYVFDGTKPPYKPNDEPNLLNEYGKSKLAAEQAVVQNYPSALILRLPVLYGNVESLDESSVTVLLKAVRDSSKQSKMSDYELRYPTDVADVALCVVSWQRGG